MIMFYKKFIYLIFLLISTVLLNACVVHHDDFASDSLESASVSSSTGLAELGYVNINSLPDGNGSINPVRLQALRETATTLGARGALAWRSEHIDAALSEEASNLDHVFYFNVLSIFSSKTLTSAIGASPILKLRIYSSISAFNTATSGKLFPSACIISSSLALSISSGSLSQ